MDNLKMDENVFSLNADYLTNDIKNFTFYIGKFKSFQCFSCCIFSRCPFSCSMCSNCIELFQQEMNINGIKNQFANKILQIFSKNFKSLFLSKLNSEYTQNALLTLTWSGGCVTFHRRFLGGVAIYKNLSCTFDMDVIYDGFKDCVVSRIWHSNVIIVGLYIPPINSSYFTEEYFANLELLHMIITGDLNCRVLSCRYC